MRKTNGVLKKLENSHINKQFMSNKYTFPRLENKLARLLAEAKEQNIDIIRQEASLPYKWEQNISITNVEDAS